MKKTAILAIDDDPEIRRVVSQYLEGDGFAVHTAGDAAETFGVISQNPIDLILLDMILPDIDGLNLMAKIREKNKTPIIVVSGKTDPIDRIIGLEMGADDYLTKPLHMRELSARIKSVLRRAENSNDKTQNKNDDRIFFGDWIMNCRSYEVLSASGESISLTSGEFELLHALVSSPNRVLKREQLFEITRGTDYDTFDRAVDIQIGRLRKKLNDDPRSPSLIKTIRGVGYIFIGEVKTSMAA